MRFSRNNAASRFLNNRKAIFPNDDGRLPPHRVTRLITKCKPPVLPCSHPSFVPASGRTQPAPAGTLKGAHPPPVPTPDRNSPAYTFAIQLSSIPSRGCFPLNIRSAIDTVLHADRHPWRDGFMITTDSEKHPWQVVTRHFGDYDLGDAFIEELWNYSVTRRSFWFGILE